MGRFLSEDPTGFDAGVNFYSYGLNNPIRFRDPSGLNSGGQIALPIGRAAGGTLVIMCFASGVCEAVIIGAGAVTVVAGGAYLLRDATVVSPDWRKQSQFQCGKRQGDKLRSDCMFRYLREQTFCLRYIDSPLHSMCLARALWRLSNCQKGVPDPGPLDPLDPDWSNH